ncbi:MAG: hypothetical protein ACR2RE_27425, partial [Geminicoccaceae bacterium]
MATGTRELLLPGGDSIGRRPYNNRAKVVVQDYLPRPTPDIDFKDRSYDIVREIRARTTLDQRLYPFEIACECQA